VTDETPDPEVVRREAEAERRRLLAEERARDLETARREQAAVDAEEDT
jgi:hypothetical protein